MGPDGVVICVNFQGRSTGQAYVQFATAELANKALDRNRQHIGSRYIEVFKGHPADMQGALRMVGRGSGTVTGSSAIATGGILNTGIPGMSGNPDMRYTGVVRMRGMPYSCTSADITAFFKGMQVVIDVSSCVLMPMGDRLERHLSSSRMRKQLHEQCSYTENRWDHVTWSYFEARKGK